MTVAPLVSRSGAHILYRHGLGRGAAINRYSGVDVLFPAQRANAYLPWKCSTS